MKYCRLVLGVLVLIFCYGIEPAGSVVQAASPEGLKVIESNEQGLVVEWQPPAYQIDSVLLGQDRYSQLKVGGLPTQGLPGQPELPAYRALIGLPALGEAELRIVDLQEDRLNLPDPPLPTASPQAVQLDMRDSASLPTAGPIERQPDPAVYQTDAIYPEAVSSLEAARSFRQRRVAVLAIYPVRVNPVRHELVIVRSIRLEIRFSQPATTVSRPAQPEISPADRVLQTVLLNPQALQWAEAARVDLDRLSEMDTTLAAGTSYKVVVTESGLYSVTYSDLAAAGLPVDTLDPHTFRLTHGQPRQEVAVLVQGEADGQFGPGDRLLFYARPNFSRYTDEDIYFLSYAQGNGLRMATRSGVPTGLPGGNAWQTAEAEENHYYDSLYAGRDGDRWYWDQLRQPDKKSGTYSLSLPSGPKAGVAALLTIWLRGYTDPAAAPDHRVAVAVNGTGLGEKSWDGAQEIAETFTVPAGVLQANNTVLLSLPGLSGVAVEGMWLDAFAVQYATTSASTGQMRFSGEAGKKAYTLNGWSTSTFGIFDITNPITPRLVTGFQVNQAGSTTALTIGDAEVTAAQYLVVPEGSIHFPLRIEAARFAADPAGGADYIIITHPDFAAAVSPLADHRRSRGLRVAVFDVRAIYDTFGAGRIDPEAIRAFLQHASTTWSGNAPLYGLLVGDGNYDFKNHAGWNATNFMPPYLADVDPWLHETAADNRYATFTGSDLPALMLGRLSVESAAETQTVVNKIIQYETQPFPGDWTSRYLFVADDPDGYANYAGDFHYANDVGYQQVAPPLTGYRYYLNSKPDSDSYTYENPTALRADFLNQLDTGAAAVIYHGHSSWHQWSKDGLLRWNRDPALNDVWRMNNDTRLPIILQMTCFTGYFQHPEYPTLDESLQRQPAGGAIAVWGSAGLGVETGHRTLQAGFLQAVLSNGETNLGAAILAGQMELYAGQANLDLLDTFILFGDPALTINTTIQPLEKRNYLSVVNR